MKMVEALHFNCNIVSTELGVEGIPKSLKNLRTTDEPMAFAKHVLLALNEKREEKIPTPALKYFSWENEAQKLLTLLLNSNK